jgi:hypothetical protein
MPTFVIAIFVILHGLVHLLYFAQSRRIFELAPGLTWPDGSWFFARLVSNETTRHIASVLLVIVALLFVGGGVGIFIEQGWWRMCLILASSVSILIYLLMWDGAMGKLDQKGGIAILINLAILAFFVVG